MCCKEPDAPQDIGIWGHIWNKRDRNNGNNKFIGFTNFIYYFLFVINIILEYNINHILECKLNLILEYNINNIL